eukprot:Tamp_25577.p1 GENE.Tamp_25577~~Tamp_25577.p1  ORF type:complete len:302 (-),score=45.64 Tamp_25577:17-922(-)
MEGGCAGNDSMSCEAGVVRGPVQVFDGTPLLFFHLKSPPSQLLSHISLLEEPYPSLVRSRKHPLPSPPLTISDAKDTQEAEAAMAEMLAPERLGNWNFDLFRFRQLAGEHVLSRIAFSCLSYLDLFQQLSLDVEKVRIFFAAVENGYNPCLYHNRTHAADVLQACFCLLVQGGLDKRLSADHLLAIVLAAAAHDLAHPGVNNAFLCAEEGGQYAADKDEALAQYLLPFAQTSVLEKFHAGFCLHLLDARDTAIIAHLPSERQQRIRQIISHSIHLTDMASVIFFSYFFCFSCFSIVSQGIH